MSTKRFVIGASVFRLVGGFAILFQYLINYGQHRYLYGPDGIWPWDLFTSRLNGTIDFSVYAWSRSPVYFEVCFHLGLLVALLWFLGWHTRWTTVLNFVFWWSLQTRCDMTWDGGDNIMRIVLVYAMFADVGAYASLDARRRARRPPPHPVLARAGAMLHNTAILAIAIQISLVYAVAGLTKVQGEQWRDGTALYYAMRDGEFFWPGYSEHIYQSVYLVTLLSYSAVLFQVSFPFLLFLNRRTRLLAVFAGILFHIGIGVFLGLITFALFMMAVDLTLIADNEYRTAKRWLARIPKLVGRALGQLRRPVLSES